MIRRLTAAVLVGGTALVMSVAPATAHVEPSPIAVQKGSTAEITFNLEHGCGESATTELAIKIPAGVTNPVPGEKDGWTSAASADVVTFTGGPQPAHEETKFAVTFTFPDTAGVLHFPTIQTCETGQNAWIEIPVEGEPEPEFLAPTITVTDTAPSGAELTPAEEGDGEVSAAGETVAAEPAVADDTAPATGAAAGTEASAEALDTDTPDTDAPDTAAASDTEAVETTVGSSNDSSGGGNTGTVVAIIAAALVIGGGAAAVTRQRKK